MNSKLKILSSIVFVMLFHMSCTNLSENDKETVLDDDGIAIAQNDENSAYIQFPREGVDSLLIADTDNLLIDYVDTVNYLRNNKCTYIVNADFVFYPFGTMLDFEDLHKKFKDYEFVQGDFNGVKTYKVTNQGDTLLFYFVKTYRYSWTSMEIVKASIKSNIKIHDKIHIGMSKTELCEVYSGIQCEIINEVDTCVFRSNVDDVCMNLIFSEDVLSQLEIDTDFIMPEGY